MTIFAKDYTKRVLSGSAASMFFWVNTGLTVIPLAAVTYVLFRLVRSTFSRIPLSNLSIGLSFVIIWLIVIWMLNKEFNMKAYEVQFMSLAEQPEQITTTIRWDKPLAADQQVFLIDMEGKSGNGKLKLITAAQADEFENDITATVLQEKANETQVPASWFGILNSFYIITFAPLFSRIWESRFSPSASVKFGIGLILLGLGFGVLAWASTGIEQGALTASVSLWWLVIAYLFHTLGELCVSPVGLSYVSKLAPAKLVGLMFGFWFMATAIANYLAGWSGSFIDKISDEYGLTSFFLIYTVIPIGAGVLMWVFNGWINRRMHGIN